jgi:hypothetical protein
LAYAEKLLVPGQTAKSGATTLFLAFFFHVLALRLVGGQLWFGLFVFGDADIVLDLV